MRGLSLARKRLKYRRSDRNLILELWSNKGGTCVRDSHAAVGTDLGVSTVATLSSGEKAAGDRVAAREQEWSQQSVFATLSIG